MIVALDVDYRDDHAVAAAVVIADWETERVVLEDRVHVAGIEPYEPGNFYARELPPLLAIWERLESSRATRERREGFSPAESEDRRSGRSLPRIHTLIVDGYVWLDSNDTPGLGGRLWESLDQRVCVIGVAKTRFRDGAAATEVLRGSSAKPLFVTAAGMDVEAAAARVEQMAGGHRIPVVLGAVDRLCCAE